MKSKRIHSSKMKCISFYSDGFELFEEQIAKKAQDWKEKGWIFLAFSVCQETSCGMSRTRCYMMFTKEL